MLKRLAPIISVLFCVLLDTAVIPVIYNGIFLIPLSLIAVIAIGIQLGRMYGMLYGLIAGLLLDISSGTLGLKLAPYLLIGFLIGFLLDAQPEISRSSERKERLQLLAVRAIWIFALVVLHEIILMIYQYFSTAIFEWKYVRDLLIRVVETVALCLLFYQPFHAIFIGRADQAHNSRTTREVKHF